MRLPLVFWPIAALAACSSFKNEGPSADASADGSSLADGSSGDASSDGPPSSDDAGAPDSSSLPDSAAPLDGSLSETGPTDASSGCSGDGGGPVEVLADNLSQPSVVLVDATNVYFGDDGVAGGQVYQCPKSGCATPIPLGPGFASGLGVDSANVYWNDFNAGSVVSCTIGGCNGQPRVVASSQPSVEGVTFAGTNLYWSTVGSIVTCAPSSCATPSTLATSQGNGIAPLTSEPGVVLWGTTNSGGS